MKKTALIPLRKDSKGIPGKNKKKIVGRPLFSWVLTEAIFSNLDEVYVFTDDQEIIDYVNKEYYWSKKVKTLLKKVEIPYTDTEFFILKYGTSSDPRIRRKKNVE